MTSQLILKLRLVGIFALLISLSHLTFAGESKLASLPGVPFFVKWDVSSKESSISQEFETKEYRTYLVDIFFCPTKRLENQEYNEIHKFVGNGQMYFPGGDPKRNVHSQSVGSPTPPSRDRMEPTGIASNADLQRDSKIADAKQRSNVNLLQFTKLGAGTVIAVQIKVEQLNSDGTAIVLVDQVVDSIGSIGSTPLDRSLVVKGTEPLNEHVKGGLIREMFGISLHPNRYRLTVRALNDTALPFNIETVLGVVTRPNTDPLQDH